LSLLVELFFFVDVFCWIGVAFCGVVAVLLGDALIN
jgi:hypothetical protein